MLPLHCLGVIFSSGDGSHWGWVQEFTLLNCVQHVLKTTNTKFSVFSIHLQLFHPFRELRNSPEFQAFGISTLFTAPAII